MERRISAVWTWRMLMALAVLLLLPWLVVLRCIDRPQTRVDRATGPHDMDRSIPSRKGPWGELKLFRFMVAPPNHAVADSLTVVPPVWTFVGYTPAALKALCEKAGLPAAQQTSLLQQAAWPAPGSNAVIHPSDDLVWSLSPVARSTLYGVLATDPLNPLQYEPFRVHMDMADQWFDRSGVEPRIVDQIRTLFYRRGQTVLFSDLHLILPQLPSDLDRLNVVKALSRQSALMAHLVVSPDTDLSMLFHYWRTEEGTFRSIAPLVESLQGSGKISTIDVIHLLPPFARARLYTYPDRAADAAITDYDCHWTSMNFWSHTAEPDATYADREKVRAALESRYTQVDPPYRFGDIVMLMPTPTEVIHSAVYVADGIVFTKNGPSSRSPWILMQIETMRSFYEKTGPLTIRAYRPMAENPAALR